MLLLNDSPTLTEVAEEFAHWRRTRTSPRTPEDLQQKAVKLLDHYRVNEVLKALGLCHKGLKRWKQRWSSEPGEVSSGSSTGFVRLPTSAQRTSQAAELADRLGLKLTRQIGEHDTLSIEGELSEQHWHWALELLYERGSR